MLLIKKTILLKKSKIKLFKLAENNSRIKVINAKDNQNDILNKITNTNF